MAKCQRLFGCMPFLSPPTLWDGAILYQRRMLHMILVKTWISNINVHLGQAWNSWIIQPSLVNIRTCNGISKTSRYWFPLTTAISIGPHIPLSSIGSTTYVRQTAGISQFRTGSFFCLWFWLMTKIYSGPLRTNNMTRIHPYRPTPRSNRQEVLYGIVRHRCRLKWESMSYRLENKVCFLSNIQLR